MKKIIKTLSTLLLVAVLLSGCSRVQYADSVACRDIGSAISDTLDDGLEYAELSAEHVKQYFDNTDEYDDIHTMYSTDTGDINEIGIFHASSKKNADSVETKCREYIDGMKEDSRPFIASYAPNELPKLDGAQVRRFGNYVVYTVLDDSTADKVFEKVKDSLKK